LRVRDEIAFFPQRKAAVKSPYYVAGRSSLGGGLRPYLVSGISYLADVLPSCAAPHETEYTALDMGWSRGTVEPVVRPAGGEDLHALRWKQGHCAWDQA